MKEVKKLAEEIARIYRESGAEADKYLCNARRLKNQYGSGFAVVYCWFYSVPQKWTQVEPKIFELGKQTDSFEMSKALSMSPSEIAKILNPMIFRNEISRQLKNFCKAVKSEYGSWEKFADALVGEDIFKLFQKLRKCGNIRVTFKNLVAMKILVGGDDNLFILDRHVAQIIGLGKKEHTKYKIQEKRFRELLGYAEAVTRELERSFKDVSTAKWSLAIWFNRSGILANDLLRKNKQIKDVTINQL